MLKIGSVADGNAATTLVVEGELMGPWVEELSRSCELALGSTKVLILDLGAVSFVDRAGSELLRGLADRHARLTNCAPFVAEQLKGAEQLKVKER